MEILSVTLKNFKSHSDRHFVFQPGTNAICGENGAGKTSILEAIAWTLFNHRGAYKNEDLIRSGSGSAQATVAFISNRDGRTYEVQRCTTKGYTLYDPQLGSKLDYKHIEAEILPWLRQQLGVAPGTDLAKLFANTIGVPQGTFTADFLLPAERRKPIFDAILKVEEYRQAFQQGLSLEKFAKGEVENLERAIAQYEESLQNWDALQQRQQDLHQEIEQNQTTLTQLQQELAQLQAEKDRLSAQAQQVQQFETQLQNLTIQIEAKQQANQLLEQAMQRSQQAVQLCDTHRASHQAFQQAEATLNQLEQQGKQRQAIFKQREAKQKALLEQQGELTRLTVQLENLAKAQAEIEQLQPIVQQQMELEQQQEHLQEQLQQLKALKLEQQNQARQLKKLQTEGDRLRQEIETIQALETTILQIPELEQRRDRLQEQLSRIEAARQFEAELRQLVAVGEEKRDRYQLKAEAALTLLQEMQQTVPLLATASVDSVLNALQAGVELNTDLLNRLWKILADLSEQTSAAKLQQQLKQLKTQLDVSYQQRAAFTTLEAKQTQQTQLQADIQQLQNHLAQLQSQLDAEATLQQRRSHLQTQLQALHDPRGRRQLLSRDLQQQANLQAAQTQIQQAQASIQQEIATLETQLAQFTDLEAQIDQQQQLKQAHHVGYQIYLQSQKEADQFPRLQTDLQGAIAQLQQLETSRAVLQAQHQQLTQDYDPQQWQQIEATYTEIRSRADRIAGGLPQQQKLLQELDTQLASLKTLAEKRDRAQLELKQREKIRRFITFTRKVYKEAGPRITERYVQSISKEADKLFRELLNRQNVALEWTRDYDILVQEGAHTRRLINLSGGEQMCAALAVRLALLRVLADIDVAFFDEPTTNMDRPRRESLAEAIANIKTFRQLFVISHDDTFEKVTENIILVEREYS